MDKCIIFVLSSGNSDYRKSLNQLNSTEMKTINIGDQVYHIKAQKALTVQKSNGYLFTCIDADGKKCICNSDNLLVEGMIIKTPFSGHIQTHFSKNKVYYVACDLVEYLRKNPTYKVVTMEEFEALHAAYFTYPFASITEEQYDCYLGEMYPKNWHDIAPGVNVFFCEEATSGSFHACYIHDRNTDTYWAGTKNIFTSDAELLEMFRNESVAARVSA